MDIEQLRDDVQQGRIDLNRLVDLIGMLQRQVLDLKEKLEQANKEVQAAQQRLAELEAQSPTEKCDQSYSLDGEEKRKREANKPPSKRKKKRPRRGRRSNAEKIKLSERIEQVYPKDCAPEDCWLSHTRTLWRLENGRAVRVAYEVYRTRDNRYGKIPGALGRSEFGLEITLAIAYQVYVVGLSLDKVCLLMNFFQDLSLSKSQVDALLNQLARRWEKEFDHLCTLLANSLVVHADETGWSINSVWAFLSEKARILLFGVPKDAATLSHLLDPETFEGLVVSDDAAVYRNFTQAQKCWAHLIRKAIKLTLQAPQEPTYRALADGLLETYRQACRIQRDGRLSDAGRERKVADLEERLFDLCGAVWLADYPKMEGHVDNYRLLCNEVTRLLLAEELFTFVTAPAVRHPNGEEHPVSGTNNEAERTLRGSALSRATGRTNKTLRGARRQSIILSVLESLTTYLKTYTLANLIQEVMDWFERGSSCFERAAKRIAKSKHRSGILDAVLPQPDR